MFFVALGLFQLIWAPTVLWRTSATVLAAGLVVNLGAIGLWAQSRTAGAPFGPHADIPEPVGGADLCALLLQTYIVMGAAWVWYRGSRRRPLPGLAYAAALLGVTGVVALASALGVASGLQPGHHGPADTASHLHGSGDDTEYPSSSMEIVVPPPVGDLGVPAAPTQAPPAAPLPSDDTHHEHDHDHDG